MAATFITRMDGEGTGPRLAVKDLIDVEGVPTTAGCKAVAVTAEPAPADAPCLAGARAAGARIVGKVNLHELAYGATGVNPWYGTPRNPIDPGFVPGGSSSGSAVAVASGEADVAYGSDTAGSVRIPSACCGTAGLKTTHGRISIERVWPLAQSLDTVGPMARDMAGLVLGMQLLEPGFTVAGAPPTTVGRFLGVTADPRIDAAIDRALAGAELEVIDIDLPGWKAAFEATMAILLAEAWVNDRHLTAERPDLVGADVSARIGLGPGISAEALDAARATQRAWQEELVQLFGRVEVIALPTLPSFPPEIGADESWMVAATAAVNLGGHPALAMPVPTADRFPASLQLVGPLQAEESLLAAGQRLEASFP
ncbi:MAG: amidase [Acidimicrobiaceae bacterium]|nr:amidase [Acidimicrobiaceae bacterium]